MTKVVEVTISDAEWEVMRVVWTKGVTTSLTIIEVLQAKMMWKPPTIKTLIGRLVKKEMLSTESQGNKFLYRALVTEQETVHRAADSLFGHVCTRKMGQTLAKLIDESELSYADIALLEERLAAKQKVAVEKVTCLCVPGQCDCRGVN